MKMMEGVKVTSRLGAKGGPAKVVGEIAIEQFETLSEAVSFLGDEAKVLALVNTQFATNKKNETRRLANVTVSDRKVREIAINRVLSDPELLMELAGASDPATKKEELINAKMEEVRAEFEAQKGLDTAADDEEQEDA